MVDLKQNNLDITAGVIEGFFGKPWNWEARMTGADFLRNCGYQFYIYAPKSESSLRRQWREPIPLETLQHLSRLSARCRESGIAFGIGLTPFEIYRNYDAGAQASLRAKVAQIDQIGVLISTMQKGIDDKIDDIKTRLQAIESRKLGEGETRRDLGDVIGYLIGGVGMIVAVVALFLRK